MDTARRLRYLDAMGITVWRSNAFGAQDKPCVKVVADQSEHQPDPLDQALERAIQAPAPELQDIPAVREEAPLSAQPTITSPASTMDWDQLQAAVSHCKQCDLCEGRQQTVFGDGVKTADLMIIGEGPGAEEDLRGLPFVGAAGKLLDAMLAAIDFSRSPGTGQQAAYIANIVKCRPPQNRDPRPAEAAACRGYLDRQIALLQPRLIMAVGRIAAQNLLGSSDKLGTLREGLHEYRCSDAIPAIPVLVTYHPAYLLRTPSDKRKAWEDLKRARKLLADIE